MSLQEIARQSGVSYATISRAFNHPDKVHPKTLARIRKLCSELNYRPRVILNNLTAVTVVVPDYPQVEAADGILLAHTTRELNRHDLPTMITTIANLRSRPSVFQKAFIAIPRNCPESDLQLLRQCAKGGPFIAINDMNENIGPDAIRVGSDHCGAVSLALEHMLGRGHRRIGFVCRQLERKGYTDRLATFREQMEKQGLFDESLVFCNDEQFLFQGISRISACNPTALLVADAQLTLKVLHVLSSLGKQIPRDLSMVTFEHAGGTEFFHPPLTSVVQPIDTVGESAAEIMLHCLREPEAPMKQPRLHAYRFVDRESVRFMSSES